MYSSKRTLKKLCILFFSFFVLFSCSKKEKAAASTGSATEDGFYVMNYEPEGSLPVGVKYPSVFVQFSQPVVPLTSLGTPSDKSDVFSIEPAMNGVFRWYGTSLLSFECTDEVIPQMEYKIKVNSSLTSISGEKLQGPTEFTFRTEELKLTSIIPGYGSQKDGNYIDSADVPLAESTDIAVYFSYPVNPKVISEYIHVTDDAQTEYKISVSAIEGENAVRLKLSGAEIPENTNIYIKLAEGARSEKDYLGTSEEQCLSFHTIQPFCLRDTTTEGYSYGKYTNPVYLYFSHVLSEGVTDYLIKNIKTEPAMKITSENIEVSGSRVTIYGLPVEFEQDYSMTIPAGIKDMWGRKTDEAEELDIHVPAAASTAEFKDYGSGILEAQFSPKIAFTYQNIYPGSFYTVNKGSDNAYTVTYDAEKVPKNTRVVETVDLTPFLTKSGDHYYGFADFYSEIIVKDRWGDDDSRYTQRNHQLIQVTDLGVTVRYGYNKVAALVASLETGKPVAGAEVVAIASYDSGDVEYTTKNGIAEGTVLGRAKTNEQGLAVIDMSSVKFNETLIKYKTDCITLEVVKGDDRVVFRPNTTSMWRYVDGWVHSPKDAEKVTDVHFMFTDRGLYKPGETVSFRGITRQLKLGEYHSQANLDYTVEVQEDVWKGKTIATLKGKTSAAGGFWGSFKLPSDLEPGTYRIVYIPSSGGAKKYEYFTVAYFERLRFSASASIPSITYTRGDRIDAQVSASYLGGGSLAGSTYSASWFREPVGFSLSDRKFENYRFGPVQGYDSRSYIGNEQGVLNAEGSASTSTKSGSETLKGMAYQYTAEIRVQDSGNQEVSTRTGTLVHPAAYYIGISAPKGVRGFPKKGQKIDFDFQLVTPTGDAPNASLLPSKKTAQKMTVELLREEWKLVRQMGVNGYVNTRYVREMVTDYSQEVSLSQSGTFSVTPEKGGSYVLRVSSTDKAGNDVVTERRFYAIGSDWYYYGNQSDELTLMCDKNYYAVGETAQIMLQSPLEKGRYLMTIEREGIFSEKILEINEPVSVINVPIEEKYLPVVYVTLSSYSQRTGEPSADFDTPDMNKPKGYFGLATLHIDISNVMFDIKVEPDKPSYRPGEKANFKITATKNGKPVSNAELTLMAVDRGVIDLINYHVPDPAAYFYSEGRFPICVSGGDTRSLLIDPVTYAAKNLFGGDSDSDSDEKMDERKNFNPTAIFEPCLITDADGTATYSFTWPDNLTAYRVTVVGIEGDRFALKESEVNVTNPISVRDVLPRRLRVDDVSEAGVVISNLQNAPQSVKISMHLFDGIEKTGMPTEEDGKIIQSGSASPTGKTEQTITVPANSTLPVMFPLKADKSGFVTVQFTVKSDLVNERIIKPLEIDKQYVCETVTTVGQTAAGDSKKASNPADNTAKEMIVIPGDAAGNIGSLTVQLDPSRLGVLKEAVNYVFHYPYGCLEQRSSAILPLVYFSDYIKVFGLESEVSKPAKVVEKELKYWAKSQKNNGAFPYWPSGAYESFPVTLRIAEILTAAKENDIKIPNDINMGKLGSYISSQLNDNVSKHGELANPYMFAYTNYILTKLGLPVSEQRIRLIAENEAFDIDAMCYAGLMYIERGEKDKAKAITETIRKYMKPTTRGVDISNKHGYWSYWYYFGGETETYSLCLKLFSLVNPSDEMNGRLVYQLLQLQKAGNGYWRSTATTARVLDSLNTYIKANNLEDTDFTAEALINGKKILDGKFKGVAALPVETTKAFSEEPVSSIKRDVEIPVEFTKKGNGTLFYTLSMKYAIPAEKQYARDEGICVFMDIIDLETGKSVTENKLQAGKVYKAKIILSSTRDRTFVALRAPIPSGAEVLNAAFVTTGSYSEYDEKEERDNDYYYDYHYGLSNQTIYDNEVQYFWDMFPKGRQQVDFMFRAVRSGSYQTPGASAECMYESEIFGRSAGKVFVIE